MKSLILFLLTAALLTCSPAHANPFDRFTQNVNNSWTLTDGDGDTLTVCGCPVDSAGNPYPLNAQGQPVIPHLETVVAPDPADPTTWAGAVTPGACAKITDAAGNLIGMVDGAGNSLPIVSPQPTSETETSTDPTTWTQSTTGDLVLHKDASGNLLGLSLGGQMCPIAAGFSLTTGQVAGPYDPSTGPLSYLGTPSDGDVHVSCGQNCVAIHSYAAGAWALRCEMAGKNVAQKSSGNIITLQELADQERAYSNSTGAQRYNSDSVLLTDLIHHQASSADGPSSIVPSGYAGHDGYPGSGGVSHQGTGIGKWGHPIDVDNGFGDSVQVLGTGTTPRAGLEVREGSIWLTRSAARADQRLWEFSSTAKFSGNNPTDGVLYIRPRYDTRARMNSGFCFDTFRNLSLTDAQGVQSPRFGSIGSLVLGDDSVGQTNPFNALPTASLPNGMTVVNSLGGEVWAQDNALNAVQITPHDSAAAVALGFATATFAVKSLNGWTLIAEFAPAPGAEVAYVDAVTGDFAVYGIADLQEAGYRGIEAGQLTSHLVSADTIAPNGSAVAGGKLSPTRTGQSDHLKLIERYDYALGYPVVTSEEDREILSKLNSREGLRARFSPVGSTAAERVDSHNEASAKFVADLQEAWDKDNDLRQELRQELPHRPADYVPMPNIYRASQPE